MKINEWFDPKNLEHLRAYDHLRNHGVWPVGFISDDIEFSSTWQVELLGMMTNEYINEKLLLKE